MATDRASACSGTGAAQPVLEGVDRLRQSVRGQIVVPSDAGYEQARKVWNGAIDRRPALIVYCACSSDVVKAVNFARGGHHAVAVRSGGHNLAGLSVCDAGVVIDLSRMKQIDVDPVRRIARAQAGLTLHEFDEATQAHGLATTMGVNGDTGIAGLTLGGGFGKLGRKYGLACDNLAAVEMVTADGECRRASATENPDLFWAVRGGGGNFGIVTTFEYVLHPIGTNLLAGSLAYRYGDARDAMRFYAAFARSAPDELSLDAALVTAPSGERFFNVSICYVGAKEEGERVVAPLMAFGAPEARPLAPVPYLQLQSASDAVFPRGRRYYWKAQFLSELSNGAIDTLLRVYEVAPSRAAMFILQQVGGAIARVPKPATAYANREALFDGFPLSIWDDATEDDVNIRWAREAWSALRPFSTGGVYANNLGDEGEDRVRAAFGENYSRLVEVKQRYDPDNFFRLNQNVRPTP